MPDFNISELSPCSALSGSELLPISQRDVNNKNVPSTVVTTIFNFADYCKDTIILPGTIWVYAAPIDKKDVKPPTGWLLCDGSTYPVSTYKRLYDAIGDTYGMTLTPGTIFRVPNLKGRFVMGYCSYNKAVVPNFGSFLGQGIILGRAGGEYNHILTDTAMPRHTHNLENKTPPRSHLSYPDYKRVDPDAGTITGSVKQQQGRSVGFFQSGKNGKRDGPGSDLDYIELGGISTNVTGKTQPHSNTPPYICLNHIIKY